MLLSIDHCGLVKKVLDPIRQHVCQVTGLPWEAVYIAATHTHTGPLMNPDPTDPQEIHYAQIVKYKMADAVRMALLDMKPARMGYGIGKAPNVSFVRRYHMKDGSTRTNPGVNNPNIVEPVGQVDDRVSVMRFQREDGRNLVLAYFANHPDVVGGTKISADWPGFLRRTVEKVLDNTQCIFFNGAQGDVNHVNVRPSGGWMNGIDK